MSKLTTAEDKLLKRGFDWATDSSGYDPSSDDYDVLTYITDHPEALVKEISGALSIPNHRIVAALGRLKTAGKIQTVEPLDSFTKTKELQANYLKLVNPDCSTGNDEPLETVIDFRPKESDLPIVETCSTGNERSCVNDETEPGTLVKILDSDGLWKIDTIKDGHAKVDLVEGDRKLPKRRRVALHKLRVNVVLGETVQNDIPHWLTGKNASEAKALIDLGFWFVGTVDEWGEPEQSKIIETSGDWSFNYDYIGMFIEARCNGAVFNIDVEETNEEQDKELVNKAVATIKKAAEDWGLQFGQQLELNLDNCEQTQNREQENILLTNPPRQVDANGQLSIFFDDSEEPPDPDDFETGEEYEQAYDKWATLYPEIERAINQAKVREFQNTHWSNGDHVQLISDPRRIGQLIGIKNGGLYKIKFADGFVTELKADTFLDQPFCKENSEVVLGESFFKVGEFVVTSAPGFEDKIFKVEKIYHTGMIGVIDKSNQSFSFPANWLNHYVEKVGKSKGKILENSERKRPAKGCGSGSLVVRQANKKRNAAKGRDPDIYYVYCYSYTDNYGKEIKSSISVPREKIAHVKGMIERKEHYVKIAKFLGKSLPCYY